LGDMCPHRFAPLHKGCVKADIIECPYHGLQFDATGACVFNPHGGGKIPAINRTPAYVLEERDGALWIWMGEPDKADTDQIIDTSFLNAGSEFAYRTGCHPINANYFLIVDNLLDLTHAQFLHPETVYGKTAAERWDVHLAGKNEIEEDSAQEVWFEEDDASLTAHYMMRSKPTPPLWEQIVDTTICDLYSRIIWNAPANLDLYLELVAKDEGMDPTPARIQVMHFITPIDDMSFYYFIAVGWDVNTNDTEAADAVERIVQQTIVEEDGPMVEMCQAYMGENIDLFSMRPILLQTDSMAIQARRRMDKLLKAQT